MGIPDLSLALSTKPTSEDISAACTAASGFKIVVKLSKRFQRVLALGLQVQGERRPAQAGRCGRMAA